MRAQLLDDHPPAEATAVASAVAGIQAQDITAAAMSIRARSPDLALAGLRRAVWEDRSLVLTWSMRGTRHLHPAADLRWLLAVFGPVFGRPGRRAEQLGIAGAAGDHAVAALRGALAAEGMLTRSEVKGRLAAVGVDVSGQAPVHVLRRAALEGVLCVLPDPHGPERYVLLDDWVPPAGLPSREEALGMLASRYVGAFGPATLQDFRVWSGLPAAQAELGWAATAGQAEQAGQAPDLPAPPARCPVRLTGGFDALLLGYADRSLHLAPEHARRVNTGGGLVKPLVLDDGVVVATWRYVRGATDTIEVGPFHPLPGRAVRGIEREVREIGAFLGRDPHLELMPPGRA
ncbi:MAG: hypothetical protein QOD01_392 [Actinomycetota bacterium]|jgi:hypothetical protein|nr:hypothetical protein [Actinomycetota bacterium]